MAVAPAATAAPATPAAATMGTTADQAAGSCWEIKQVRPSAADGAYWLLTPAMTAPQQFYCDMTTDGGGWVLVGKGRDGWVTDYDGKSAESTLTTPGLSPMSAATSQLPSRRIDALLNKAPVTSLSDGIRLRRAKDATGTTWQEDRLKFSKGDRWTWTFGAAHPMSSYSIDGVSTSGGTTTSFGTDNSFKRVINTTNTAQGFHLGFAYGSGVAGTNATTTYLWSKTNNAGGALPFTQVYLRPKVLSTDAGFSAVPDGGTAASAQTSVASSVADDLPWHVSGLAGSAATEGNVEVQAFTQSGNTMYVGGNFKYAQRGAASTGADQVAQPFLAGFDVTTGELVTSFRPVLNEQVRALATLPNGDVVAGGDFSSANGAAATGIVALDPTTGATDPAWNVKLENRTTAGVLAVQTLRVGGNQLYIGGSFTHVTGGTSATAAYMRNGASVSVTNGAPRRDWNPNFNGTVLDVDPSEDGTRVYFSGFFSTENGAAAKSVAAVSTAAGAALVTPAWAPTWSSTGKFYQRAIEEVGSNVYVGGSEHSLFQFNTSTLARTAGHIMMDKGDIQAIADSGTGVLYAGCHCNQFNYTNSFNWPNIGTDWTQVDAITWFGAYNSTTEATLPAFTPTMTSRLGSGVWAIQTDSNGRVWAGGDLRTARTSASMSAWAGGFTRFSLNDSTAPTTPSGLTATGTTATSTTLGWSASSDATAVTYQILRDDRVIATTTARTATVPLGGDNRFFVRAADRSGNVSASTPVTTAAAQVNVPPTAAFTSRMTLRTAAFDASTSTDTDGTIVSYAWDFGDNATATGVTPSHTYATQGTYRVSLRVTDDRGATATTSATVTTSNQSTTDTGGRGQRRTMGVEVRGRSTTRRLGPVHLRHLLLGHR